MKTLQILIVIILIAGSVTLLYSTLYFELAERFSEDVRNGLVCNRPGGSCPVPDFSDPMFYATIGLVMFSIGAILSVFKDKSKSTKLIFGITSLTAGIPALILSVFAYADDYSHIESIIKNCSNTPCMYPDIYYNISIIQFFGIYGLILVAIGIISLAYFRRGSKK
jgi:hypothetical protein